MRNKVLVVIPTFNESGNISRLADEILLKSSFDILFVDDGSSDGTLEEINSLISNHTDRVRVVNRGVKLGVGSAHKFGLNFAHKNSYALAITMDADWTHNPKYLSKLELELMSSRADILIGSRFMSSDSLNEWQPWRRFVTRCVRLLTRVVLGLKFDNSSGFRCHRISDKLINVINSTRSDNYDYFFESLYRLKLNNFSIRETSIKLLPRKEGSSKLTTSLAFQALWSLIKVRLFVQHPSI